MTSIIYTAKREIHVDHIPSEKILNGTFTSNANNWLPVNSAILSSISGELRIQANVTNAPGAYQSIATVIGRSYDLSVSGYIGTMTSWKIGVGDFANSSSVINSPSYSNSAIESKFFTFIATSTLTFITLRTSGVNDTGTIFFDDISVRESGIISLDLISSSLSRKMPLRANPQVSIDGTTETIFHRKDSVWDYNSDLISRQNLIDDYWIEMTSSIHGGETFTFDQYGTLASPQSPKACVLVGEPRIRDNGALFHRVSFTVRELP